MEQSFKVCPRCGQPAVLSMANCGRCGLAYPTVPEFARYQRASNGPSAGVAPGRQWIAPLAIAVVVIALMCTALVLALSLAHRGIEAGSLLSVPGHPGDSPQSMMRSNRAPRLYTDPTAGPFVERPGQSETPTIHVFHDASGTLTLTLTASNGMVYRTQSTNGVEGTMRVPAGDYRLDVECNDPGVLPNSGDARFRRFKDYTAEFTHTIDPQPLHLGD